MIELGDKRTVFVDCDETLVNWNLDKSLDIDVHGVIKFETPNGQLELIPHWQHIDFLKKIKMQGYTIVVWSACGGKWASDVVHRLGLQSHVDATMSKPEFAIDDLLDAKRIIKSILWIDPKTGEFKRST